MLWEGSITSRQDWLLGACISELEYRHRREKSVWKRCVCFLCAPTYPPPDDLTSSASDRS